MRLIRSIGSAIASVFTLLALLVIGGAVALIGYFASAILTGAAIIGVVYLAFYEFFGTKKDG